MMMIIIFVILLLIINYIGEEIKKREWEICGGCQIGMEIEMELYYNYTGEKGKANQTKTLLSFSISTVTPPS